MAGGRWSRGGYDSDTGLRNRFLSGLRNIFFLNKNNINAIIIAVIIAHPSLVPHPMKGFLIITPYI
jgi:hypothetical protein